MTRVKQFPDLIKSNEMILALNSKGFELEGSIHHRPTLIWFIANHQDGARLAFQIQGDTLSYKLYPSMTKAIVASVLSAIILIVLNSLFYYATDVSLGPAPILALVSIISAASYFIRRELYNFNYSYILEELDNLSNLSSD